MHVERIEWVDMCRYCRVDYRLLGDDNQTTIIWLGGLFLHQSTEIVSPLNWQFQNIKNKKMSSSHGWIQRGDTRNIQSSKTGG